MASAEMFAQFIRGAADFEQAMAKVSAAMKVVASGAVGLVHTFTRSFDPKRWEVQVCGWEARMKVRGGMLGVLTDDPQRDHAVQAILRGRTFDTDLVGLTPGERARLAVAFLEGWTRSNVDPHPCGRRCQYAEDIGAPDWASCADGVDRCSWYQYPHLSLEHDGPDHSSLVVVR